MQKNGNQTSATPKLHEIWLDIFRSWGRDSYALNRFLREFDKADRDPARTAAELNAFAYTLQKLFVEGYILVPASQQGPDATPPNGPAASRGSGEPAAAPSAGGSGPAASRGSGESAAAPTAGGSASQGVVGLEAKTLAQIVFEQLNDVVEL